VGITYWNPFKKRRPWPPLFLYLKFLF
jgi:hypothetical protein